MKYENILTI